MVGICQGGRLFNEETYREEAAIKSKRVCFPFISVIAKRPMVFTIGDPDFHFTFPLFNVMVGKGWRM